MYNETEASEYPEKIKEESFQNYKFEKSIICPKCYSVPIIELIFEDNTVKINLSCSDCQYSSKYSHIKDYLKELSNLKTADLYCTCHCGEKARKFCRTCKKLLCNQCFKDHMNWLSDHKTVNTPKFSVPATNCQKHGLPFLFYCYTCKMNVCYQCFLSEHSKHNNIKLDVINFFANIEETKKEMNRVTDYIEIDVKNIVKKYIEQLNIKIKKIEQIYKEFKGNCENVIDFFDLIINNYSSVSQNYYQMNNLILLSGWTLSKYKISEDEDYQDPEEFLSYLRSNQIMKQEIKIKKAGDNNIIVRINKILI